MWKCLYISTNTCAQLNMAIKEVYKEEAFEEEGIEDIEEVFKEAGIDDIL